MTYDDRTAYLVLASLTTPGNAEVGSLIRGSGPVLALDRILHSRDRSSELTEAVSTRLSGRAQADVRHVADAMLRHADQVGARIITPADDEWPAPLHDLAHSLPGHDGTGTGADLDSPLCLWARGPLHLAGTIERSVAIVGARAMTAYGQGIASEFAYDLAGRDWTVVAGGALGIDVTAHRGALLARGRTVAVLPCGIDQRYPAANAAVLETLGAEGLLLTELAPGTLPTRSAFLSRNRIIAAATRGTVVIEAGARSGARNTLAHARRLRRPAMVVPGPITSAMSAGCHVELRRPDTILVSTVDEIIEEIGGLDRPPAPPPS